MNMSNHRFSNPNRRPNIEEIAKNFEKAETINHIAGKMQDQMKSVAQSNPLERQVNLSARSRVKLLDQIERFRQESGRFGNSLAEAAYYTI